MASQAAPPLVRIAGKGRQPAAVERIRDLEDELTALLAEGVAVADELAALAHRIELAIHAERDDIALHVAGRLASLAESWHRRGTAA